MTPQQALAFVKGRGIVLESARGPVPSLAEAIAGKPVAGSWWGHPKGEAIFVCSRVIRNSREVLTCRLINGKVTYVHQRLWPALLRLSGSFKAGRLAPIREIHTAAGTHRVEERPFSKWVSPEVRRQSARLSREKAKSLLESAGLFRLRSANEIR